MNDLEKQQGTASILHQTLCIISNPLVNSNWSYSPEMLNSGKNWRFAVPRELEIWWMTLKKIGHLFYTTLSFVQHFKAIGIFKLELQSGNAQFGSKFAFFCLGDFENRRMTLKNNRASPIYYVQLCASFQIHWWSQTWVTAWKRSSRVKTGDFLSRVTLKIDVWPLKTIGHLSYAASTFVHNFIVNGQFKLELQSGNSQFGSKSTIFLPCDLEIWRITLKNNRVHLLSKIKLCASFHRHMWIQTGVTVQKQLNGVMTSVTLTSDLDLLHGHRICQW